MKYLFALFLFSLLLLGCTTSTKTSEPIKIIKKAGSEENKTVAQKPEVIITENGSLTKRAPQEPSAPNAAKPPTERGQQTRGTGIYTISDWVTYEIPNFSFDYPSAFRLTDSIAGYRDGAGYGSIAIQSNDAKGTLLLVTYNNYSEGSLVGNNAEEVAASILAEDNSDTEDRMGLLHKGVSKSAITTFTTPRGYGAAEIIFRMPPDEGNGTKLFYGYALQFYDFKDNVGIGIRVISLNDTTAVEIRDRFTTTVNVGG